MVYRLDYTPDLLDDIQPDYLAAEYQYITEIVRYKPAGNSEEEKLLGELAQHLIEYDLDGVLEIL